MKKIITFIIAFVVMIGFVNAEGKVKVYMFEAGGCPYCEAQEEYLKGLAGYGKTFELVKKELYVDHVDWKQGKDYALGKAVAEAFNEAGFEDASYEGTPFVVISDLYAAASYNTELEDIITLAYEEGDRDVVSCIKSGGTTTECIRADIISNNTSSKESKIANSKAGVVIAVIGIIAFVGVVIYVLTKRDSDVARVEEEVEEKPVRKVARKTPAKKAETKKTTTRKTTTRKTTK